MTSHDYDSLQDKEPGEGFETTIEPQVNAQTKYRTLLGQTLSNVRTVLLLSVTLSTIALVGGFFTGKAYQLKLLVSDQPSPQPEDFFPSCMRIRVSLPGER